MKNGRKEEFIYGDIVRILGLFYSVEKFLFSIFLIGFEGWVLEIKRVFEEFIDKDDWRIVDL